MKSRFKYLIASTLIISLAFGFQNTLGQTLKKYEINAEVAPVKIYSDHLKMGGSNPKGETILVNNYFLSKSGNPFIPITGEFHFSRYPNQYWEESIQKMKAGGINIIATYVFWNIHEEHEGKFRWDGDRDLKKFIALCAKNDMYVFVRVGPFCHGEIRNGGLPDWLLGRPLMIRSNDPAYLSYVEKLYDEIGTQLKGTYFKDGGSVIGIQLENEYQHSAAPWGLTYAGQPHDWTAAESDLSLTQAGVGVSETKNPYADLGNDHMKILKSLALKAGMDVPLYTATGWGNAAIVTNESIPVTAAYAYPFWTAHKDISPFFLYKDMHCDPDYAPVRYQPEDYPAFPAELGTGIMTVYSRRPIVEQKSFDAMMNRCLGSGANGLGYYMYHSGSTPRGDRYYFSDEAYGLPKISYDFQAPIGEFGQVREGFQRLKLINRFAQEFGDLLAPMTTVLPENAPILKPENVTDLRYAVRIKDNSGFLFVNNFQDDLKTTDKPDIQIAIKTGGDVVTIPEASGFTMKEGENVIFPFHLAINGADLIYATAQLYTKSDDGKMPYYVFVSQDGSNAEFSFAKSNGLSIKKSPGISLDQNEKRILVKCSKGTSEFTANVKGRQTKILVIEKSLALQSYLVTIKGQKSLMFSDAVILQENDMISALSAGRNAFTIHVYPKFLGKLNAENAAVLASVNNSLMSEFNISVPEFKLEPTVRQIGERKTVVTLPPSLNGLNDLFLNIDYTGDTGMGFLDGELVTDEFWKGTLWQIGLKKFYPNAASKEMVFYFRPVNEGASYLDDISPKDRPDFSKLKQVLNIRKISFTPEYKVNLQFE
ncbi:beta-galactosidase [Aquipluma nitroreducens]|uniref:Beta-galactosidase n=1 Tax=Aquipluma nitroreducens TaxID=2010828 RepID=A0A5K7SD57_9BACT|nr:beta-galactosidase [Aquipluma nitroreducens]BBE19498.1 beta-galactosidase [Aquipluma nitroreducens]